MAGFTETRQLWLLPQTMWLVPKGPLTTVELSGDLPGGVGGDRPDVGQIAVSGTGRVAFIGALGDHQRRAGENPLAVTCTVAGDFSPCDGVTVKC